MREFASAQSRIAGLSAPARILYTTFAVLTLAGIVSSIGIYDDIVKFDAHATPQDLYHRLVAHYRPAADKAERAPPIAARALLETTHAHLFVMPLLLLVAGHLFLLTAASQRVKTTLIAIASAATVLHLATPWILRVGWGGPAGAALYPLSGGALLLALSILLALPVWEMWFVKANRAPSASG